MKLAAITVATTMAILATLGLATDPTGPEAARARVPTSPVRVIGARSTSDQAAADVRIAAKDILNRPTALLNKNTLVTDNNIFITRSNLVFRQNDRLALRQRVQEALQNTKEQSTTGTAVLTKSVLRAVSASSKDTTLQTKASAVIAARGGDQATLMKRVADFVDAAAEKEIQKEQEQSLQSQTPRGVIVLIGTKDVLRQPTAIVNKNIAFTDDQIQIARSQLAPSQNDKVTMSGGAKVADAILPGSAVTIGQLKAVKSGDSDDSDNASDDTSKLKKMMKTKKMKKEYRVRIAYPKDGEAADDRTKSTNKQEHWGHGWGFGWRYPLGYWNMYGPQFYGGGCGLGFARGPYYYC